LRNCRGTARYFTTALPGATAELHFAHGLYVMLASDRALDEQEARQVATDLSDDLSKVGLPVRHAGSFGFDFVATEWCYHRPSSRYVVRIAVADLATWSLVSDPCRRDPFLRQLRLLLRRAYSIFAGLLQTIDSFCAYVAECESVRGQAAVGIGSNDLRPIKKGRSAWGYDRRRLGPHPDPGICNKELLPLVQGA
jgi:hypothetical protein